MKRYWLGRFAFSFLIIGTFLAWTGYQASIGRMGNVSQTRIVFYFVAAMASFVMFILGTRERHRRE